MSWVSVHTVTVYSNLDHLFNLGKPNERFWSAEQQLQQGRGTCTCRYSARLPSSFHLSAGTIILSIKSSSAITLFSTVWMAGCASNIKEAFSFSKSCVLASLSFYIIICSAFGRGTDRNRRVIYCKTPSLCSFKTTDLPVSLLPADNPPFWVGWAWNHQLISHWRGGEWPQDVILCVRRVANI